MAGLIFLAAVVAFLLFCIWLSKTIGNLVPNAAWRGAVKVGIFLALLAAPFVDEVIGKYQFEALCKANGIERADVSKGQGRRVKLQVGVRSLLDGTVMPISVEDWTYTDINTGGVLFRHKDYYATGGWLMRYTPISMGSDHPMLFRGNGCSLVLWQQLLNAAQVTVIN